MAMDSIHLVEELAWMVKDNLASKHLVLSMEEKFMHLLNPTYCGEKTLILEPMVSYHRMLLHRLADIFKLAHESIGEGDDRRIVVERWECSTIPDVLVSDILQCINQKKGSPLRMTQQLLKRDIDLTGIRDGPPMQVPPVSLQGRRVAIAASRECFFPEDCYQQVEIAKAHPAPRPRSVPVAAQRMISHALGKRVSADTYSSNIIASSKLDTEKSLDQNSIQGEQSLIKHFPDKEAKQLLANALGLPLSNSSSRDSAKQLSIKLNNIACKEGNVLESENSQTSGMRLKGKGNRTKNMMPEETLAVVARTDCTQGQPLQ